jgi:hypothetical protein
MDTEAGWCLTLRIFRKRLAKSPLSTPALMEGYVFPKLSVRRTREHYGTGDRYRQAPAVALARGLNANLLRRWVQEAERRGTPIAIRTTAPSVAMQGAESFLPVTLPGNPTESLIRVEIRRKGRTVSMQWPASAARECTRLLRGLLK